MMRPYFRLMASMTFMLGLTLPAMGLASFPDETSDAGDAQPGVSTRGTDKSNTQIANEMTNPMAAYTSFTYRYEHRTFKGDIEGASEQKTDSHVFGVVIPFRQVDGQGFVLRLSLPYIDDESIYWADRGYPQWLIRQQDPRLQGDGYWNDTHGHTGDMMADIVYGGVDDNGFILMYGLKNRFPTSSDTSNARQQWVVGPLINVGQHAHWGTYGAMFSHIIDVVEKPDKGTPDTSISSIEAYFSYAFGNGWQIISNPVIQYDWEADSGNKLTVPLAIGIAKTTRMGRMPLRLAAEFQKNVVTTDRFDSDMLLTFSITPALSNRFTRN